MDWFVEKELFDIVLLRNLFNELRLLLEHALPVILNIRLNITILNVIREKETQMLNFSNK